MAQERLTSIGNRFLEDLPKRERQWVEEHSDIVDLKFGTVLCEPGKPLDYVYFPLHGFVSLVATVHGHPPLELGLIGREGMLGVTLLLGVNTAPMQSIVQGAGSFVRMTAGRCRRALQECPALRVTLGRYLYVLMEQLAQMTACTNFHEINARLARWLLTTHDRAHADHFHLTQKFLADMLGVQRSAVTIAAGNLQRRALIRYSRGEISILSRKGLEGEACECYAAVTADYARQFA